MPGGRGTPHAAIRLDPRLWERLDEVTRAAGTTRAAVLRQLIRWYLREADVKLPPRPARGE